MNSRIVRSIALAAALLVGSSAVLCAAKPQQDLEASALRLITAIENPNYEAFVAGGTAAFKQLKKEQFDSVAAQISPRLRAGYGVSFLGELSQKGYRVALLKISFKDGGDDLLVTLSVKGGEIAGFNIR